MVSENRIEKKSYVSAIIITAGIKTKVFSNFLSLLILHEFANFNDFSTLCIGVAVLAKCRDCCQLYFFYAAFRLQILVRST